jgi:hypothetical protein
MRPGFAIASWFFITSALCPPSLTPSQTQCKNHFQIVAAKRVPASRGGARCLEKNPSICYLKTKKEEVDPFTPQLQATGSPALTPLL